jgi:hypothetical protein
MAWCKLEISQLALYIVQKGVALDINSVKDDSSPIQQKIAN